MFFSEEDEGKTHISEGGCVKKTFSVPTIYNECSELVTAKEDFLN